MVIELAKLKDIHDQFVETLKNIQIVNQFYHKLNKIHDCVEASLEIGTRKLEIEGLLKISEEKLKEFIKVQSEAIPFISSIPVFYSKNIILTWRIKNFYTIMSRVRDNLVLLNYHAKLSELEYIAKNSTVFNEFLKIRLLELEKDFLALTSTNISNFELDRLAIFTRRDRMHDLFKVNTPFRKAKKTVLN
jgi:hypothetical protein